MQNDDYGPVLQVERQFFVGFKRVWGQNIKKTGIFAKTRRKKRPLTCKTAIMDPLGSIIVVLQVRGTILAQNPIKMANRKNRPPPVIYGPEPHSNEIKEN